MKELKTEEPSVMSSRENSTRLIMQLFYYRQMVLRRTNVVIVSEL